MPLIVDVGGLGFIDFQVGEFLPRVDERVYMIHDASTAHIELFPDEAEITIARFAAQIEKIDYPVKLLIPVDGVRHNTYRGEAPYYKEVGGIIIRQLEEIRNLSVETVTVLESLDTEGWSIQAVHHMVDELGGHVVIDDEVQY